MALDFTGAEYVIRASPLQYCGKAWAKSGGLEAADQATELVTRRTQKMHSLLNGVTLRS